MKGFLKFFLLAAVVIAFMFWSAITAHSNPKTKRVFCVAATYARISPTEWVGISNCGNLWKVVVPSKIDVPPSIGKAEGEHAEAWFFDEKEGTWAQFEKVPALGDTLGYVDIPESK